MLSASQNMWLYRKSRCGGLNLLKLTRSDEEIAFEMLPFQPLTVAIRQTFCVWFG